MKSGPIQTQPLGLLGMLQLKNKGQNPAVLLDEVAPNIDLTEWLMVQDQQPLVGTRSLASGSFSAFIGMTGGDTLVVPDTEIWYCWDMTVVSTVQAADTIASFAAMILIPGTTAALIQVGNSIQRPATGAHVAIAGGQVRSWFGPGCTFGVGGGPFVTAATIDTSVNLRITRLPT